MLTQVCFQLICTQGSVDIEEEAGKLGRKEPYILLSETDEITEQHNVVENTCMVTTRRTHFQVHYQHHLHALLLS